MRLPLASLALAILSALLGVSALLGWALDSASLKHGMASSVAMNPTTAFCLILLGLEAIRISTSSAHPVLSKAGQLAIIVVIVASLMKLSDLLFGTSFAIDQYLFSTKLAEESIYPNRMAPNTATSILLLGLAMQFMRGNADTSALKAQSLGGVVLLIALLALIGNLFNAKELSGVADYIPMAFNTAISFCFLSISILSARLDRGLMKFFRWHSLKTRITFATFAIFLAGLWSLSFFASQTLRKDMERLLGEQQFSTVSVVAAQINDQMSDRLKALENYATVRITPALLADSAAMQTRLEESLLILKLFNGGIWVTRQDGISVASVPPARIGTYFGDREYIIAALKDGKSTFSKPIVGRVSKVPNFVTAVPIRDTQGKVIGVLVGVTDLDKPNFFDTIAKGQYGKTGRLMVVVRQSRLIVTATDKSRIMTVIPGPGFIPALDRFLEGQEGSAVYVNPLGVETLVSVKDIPIAGWNMVALLPTDEGFAPIRAMQQNMLLATIFLTLLAGGLTWLTLRRQLAPLLTTAKTLAVQSGSNLPQQPLPITRQDEIGDLICGFNRLLETLRQREEVLRESQRVAHLGGWSIDVASGQLSWTEETFHIHELPVGEQPTVEQAVNFYLPDSRTIIEEAVRASLENGAPFDLELQIKTAKENIRWVHARGEARYADGVPPRVVSGTFQDITERKQDELALRESHTTLSTILETTLDGFWRTDGQGNLLHVNAAYCQKSGYSRDELLGRVLN